MRWQHRGTSDVCRDRRAHLSWCLVMTVGRSILGKGQGHERKADSKKNEEFGQERCHCAQCG